MKKTYVEEGAGAEAERTDRLQASGGLGDLPFAPLRRYAKDPSQVYAIRIPVTRLAAIRSLADARGEQPTSLLREWVLERLDTELATEAHAVREPAKVYASRARATAVKPARKAAAGVVKQKRKPAEVAVTKKKRKVVAKGSSAKTRSAKSR